MITIIFIAVKTTPLNLTNMITNNNSLSHRTATNDKYASIFISAKQTKT